MMLIIIEIDFMGWQERGSFMRLVSFVEFPFSLALYATIPSVQAKKWSRLWYYSLTISLFYVIVIHVYALPLSCE
jgi:hypothetical protein